MLLHIFKKKKKHHEVFTQKCSLYRSNSQSFTLLTFSLFVFGSWNLVNGSIITSTLTYTTDQSQDTDATTIFPDTTNVENTKLKVNLEPPKIRVSIVESGVIKEILSDKAGETVVVPVKKYDLHIGQDVPTKVMRFDCNGTYPVEWVYEGHGSPFHVVSKTFRHIQNFSDPSTYTFSTFVDLTRNDELNSGKYVCKEISKNRTETTTYFQLYVPGDKLFLPMKSETTRLKRNATQFTVACPISDLNASRSIRLYSDNGKGSKSLKVKSVSSYDPSIGFKVLIDPKLHLIDYKGRYFCKDSLTKKVSGKHTVLPPKGDYVRVSPDTGFIKIVPGVKQIFICAAKENVTLTFSGDRQPRNIDFEMNSSSEFPYLAIFEIHPTNTTVEHTVINCVTSRDEIIHTWEFSTYVDVSIQKFYFDSQKRYQDARYVCCSNSYYKPKLEFSLCRTETECAFKKLMFDKNEETKEEFLGEYNDRIRHLNTSCILFKPFLKYTLPSGMLRCSAQGINSQVHRDFMYYFNPYRIYQAYTDDKFDTAKVHNSESIMKISKTPSKNTLVGESQRFLCYFSELFLANGIVWKIEYKNGSSYTLEKSYNNMNSNTSFSQIELTFNDTDVRAVHCYAPVKDSPTSWRNVTGHLFVREPPKVQASIQTLSGEILKNIEINSTLGVILDKAEFVVLNNSVESTPGKSLETFFVLECNSTYPVDFTYFGEGTPHLDYLPNRVVNGSVLDANAYTYSAKLRFLKVDSQIVGKYSCVSAAREFGHRNKEENLGANVNVFVPGDDLFVSTDNQSYRAWEYRESVLIPCPVLDPRQNITLLRYSNETKTFEPMISPTPQIFEPLYGFSLTKNHTPSLYGLFKCVGGRNQSSGIIQIYLPSDAIRVTPYVKEVQILNNETQAFKCESKENVTITFSDNGKNRKIVHETDFTSIYPYIASYETRVGEFNESLLWMNCTSVNDSRSMHTWELYEGDGAFIDQLSYDNTTAEMKCCTKPYRTPVIEWKNCSSVTECIIKESSCLTQNKCQPSDYKISEELDKSQMKNGCLTFDVRSRPQGLLKCVVRGVHKIVAQAMVYYYNPEKDFEVHDGYFLGTKMFDKFDVQNEKIMKLTRHNSSVNASLPIGEKVTFDCTGSKFFVSSTIKWALEAGNGTVYYMYGKDLPDYNQIHSQLEIEFETTSWKSIYCIAPNWKEYYGWRNVSMPLTFEKLKSTTLDTNLNSLLT